MDESLGERRAAILRAAVREYIRTGEPVGSKHLVDAWKLHVSSATVRNEMARLEELGFLIQPHTSAGRMPTDLGYRFVVDEIKVPVRLAGSERRELEEELTGEPASVEELLRRASDVLSRFTHHASAVLTRRARPTRVRKLDLFPVGPRSATAVLIADNGRVEQRLIPLDDALDERRIEDVGRELDRDLHGLVLEDALRTVGDRATVAPRAERPLLEGVAASFEAMLWMEDDLVLGGVANLADNEAFERTTLTRLYEALERQTTLLELLAPTSLEALQVMIGREVPAEELRACSVVIANFGAGEDARGSVGVIGPTRMDYERVMAVADAVARVLEGTLLGQAD